MAAKPKQTDMRDGLRRTPASAPTGFLGGDRIETILPLVVLALSAGMLLNGFNSALGQALAAMVNACALILLLLERPPAIVEWRRTLPVLGLAVAALAWVLLVTALRPFPDPAVPFAPDLFGAQLLSYIAGIEALLCGWMVGLRAGATGRAVDWLIAILAGSFVLGLLMRQVGTDGVLDYWLVVRQGRFQGLVGNVNVTAAAAGAVAAMALAGLLLVGGELREDSVTRGARARAGFYALAGLVSLGVVIATASRFSSLCTLAAVAIVAVLGLRGTVRVPRGLVTLLAVMALAMLLIIVRFGDALFLRTGDFGGDLAVRGKMWSHYLDLALRAPIAGYGFGSFPGVNSYFLSGIRFAELTWSANSAHDIFLQLALNGGVPYLALMVAAAATLAWQVLHGLRWRWTLLELGIAAAVLLILSSALIDIALDVPAMVTIALFLAGTLWGTALVPMSARLEAPRRPPGEQKAHISR